MASDTILNDVQDFLRSYPPFDLIEDASLRELAGEVTMQYFEEDEQIFNQGEKPFNYFFLVNKGSINISEIKSNQEEVLIDKCDEGDIFGVRASIANDTYIASAKAAEESLLYTIPMDRFNDILESHPKVALFLASGFASGVSILKSDQAEAPKDVRRLLSSGKKSNNPFIEVDTLDVAAIKKIVDCSPDHTVWQAAKMMTLFNVGSILVTDDDQRPLGIITDTDFRRKVVSIEEAVKHKPVTEIMSSPVKTIRPNLAISEVMLLMITNKVSHFCVTEDGTVNSPAIGIVSQRDVLIAQGNNPAILAKEIMKANPGNIPALKNIRDKAEQLVKSYLQQDVGVPFISNVITEINDVLIHKAGEIAEIRLKNEGLEMPKIRYCWFSLGSEGRREQMLRTDQDNGLIYEDPPEEKAEEVRNYFLKFNAHITDVLEACGFERCPANMMASNPEWCQPISGWYEYFRSWINVLDPKFLLNTNIFFDFRPILGDASLADNMKEFIFKEIDKNELFLPYLAKSALQNPPPLSFFRSFIVEKGGNHKDEFDIKARAMMPLTDAARVLAYDLKIRPYLSTFGRFEEIARVEPNLAQICEAAAMAYEILLKQRAIYGLKNGNSGRYINPDHFNKLERQTIRSTFKTIEKVQQTLEVRYRLGYIRG